MANKELKYEIHEHIAIIGESEKSDWNIEVNRIAWGKDSDNPEKAKIDIRRWNRNLDEPRMGKGISLSDDEAKNLLEALKGYEF